MLSIATDRIYSRSEQILGPLQMQMSLQRHTLVKSSQETSFGMWNLM